MNWLIDLFSEPSFLQTIVILSIICAVGLALGRIKIFGVDLGVTFVFFSGILFGHLTEILNIQPDPAMISLAQNFGLILFVYTLGVQVGPGFFTSLKHGGVKLNMLSLSVLFLGTAMALLLCPVTGISLPVMMGLLSGAATNTPMLGAAQQSMLEIHPEAVNAANDMASACAVGYPLGIVGVIIGVVVMKKLFQKKDASTPHDYNTENTYISEFHVSNPAIFGKTIRETLAPIHKDLIITRIWREGKVTIPASDTKLQKGDHVLAISSKADVDTFNIIFGETENVDWNKPDIDWNHIDGSSLVSKHVLVTRSELNGVKLGSLKLRNNFGINITRINRAGISLLASPRMRLQLGDRLTVVGHEQAIRNVSEILGNEEKVLQNPNLAAIFVGVMLGVLLGSLPLLIPGMSTPIKLGVAGGPIVVGILMGAFGPRFHLSTYTTRSANLMLRQFGITVYLACLGFSAGGSFFETVFRPEGALWILISLVLSIIPVIIVGYIASRFFKIDYAENTGMLCGSMSNPIALNYANSTVETEEPAEAYATVYPLAIFIRVITAQLIMILFN